MCQSMHGSAMFCSGEESTMVQPWTCCAQGIQYCNHPMLSQRYQVHQCSTTNGFTALWQLDYVTELITNTGEFCDRFTLLKEPNMACCIACDHETARLQWSGTTAPVAEDTAGCTTTHVHWRVETKVIAWQVVWLQIISHNGPCDIVSGGE